MVLAARLGGGLSGLRQRETVAPTLAPFHPLILERIAWLPALWAGRLLAEYRAVGYSGGYSQLIRFLKQVRPEPEPVVRFETPPGLQSQFDVAVFRFLRGKRYAVLVFLGYSSFLSLLCARWQTGWTVLRALEVVFATFNVIP